MTLSIEQSSFFHCLLSFFSSLLSSISFTTTPSPVILLFFLQNQLRLGILQGKQFLYLSPTFIFRHFNAANMPQFFLVDSVFVCKTSARSTFFVFAPPPHPFSRLLMIFCLLSISFLCFFSLSPSSCFFFFLFCGISAATPCGCEEHSTPRPRRLQTPSERALDRCVTTECPKLSTKMSHGPPRASKACA